MKTLNTILIKLLRHLIYGIVHGTILVDNSTIEHEHEKDWMTGIYVTHKPTGRHTLTIIYLDTKEKTK
jgi:hypothetical protein